ncbi:hypothetical protein SAMN05660865_00055 [Caloramator fervidus]|uniref:Uncharacterized protein n=1 Tax=Caloramator fervidus TaxID=29344 RepID=A0A1H5RK27_9CLOT|nr:hypothetical protein [Caloramator fervidus]SEF38712.1 hypothetical protein SAMN05660865_00055 [Caloramator fervidus]
MSEVFGFIKDVFNTNAFILFIISTVFLYFDGLYYKNKGLTSEARFSNICCYVLVALTIIIYIVVKIL